VVWVTATYLTRPVDEQHLVEFYRRVRPGGPGWRRIAALAGDSDVPTLFTANNVFAYIASVVAIYSMLFGMGQFLFGHYLTGSVLALLTMLGFFVVARNFSDDRWDAAERRESAESSVVPATSEEIPE